MADINILKIKLIKKETLAVCYMEERVGKKPKIHDIEDGETVHQDLKNAMVGLHIHFGLMTEFITPKQMGKIDSYDSALIKDLHVSSIHMGGAEDESYIVLTGQKTLTNGQVITINTATTRIEEDDKTRYRYMDELLKIVENVKEETMLYLGGKFAPEPQQSLPFGEGDEAGRKDKVTHAAIATPEGVVGAFVKDVNSKIKPDKSGKKAPQTADNKTGEVV